MKEPIAEENQPIAVELVLSCSDIDASAEFYVRELSFRLESVFPADNPRVAVLCGSGMRIRLELENESNQSEKVRIGAPGRQNKRIVSPEGIPIDFGEAETKSHPGVPNPELLVQNSGPDAGWVAGRAGMKYRDLIPNRLDGYLIASHIRVEHEGPVKDYVHFHRVRFQIIYCLKGWARLVYEDQGDPFIFKSGDCVLQPPGIRHRVLETSGGFEVVEVSSPAEHMTYVEHDLKLPNDRLERERAFEGQKFAWSRASETRWRNIEGIKTGETEILEASAGAVGVRVLRESKPGVRNIARSVNRMTFWYVISGSLSISCGKKKFALDAGSSAILPVNQEFVIDEITDNFEVLEVQAG